MNVLAVAIATAESERKQVHDWSSRRTRAVTCYSSFVGLTMILDEICVFVSLNLTNAHLTIPVTSLARQRLQAMREAA